MRSLLVFFGLGGLFLGWNAPNHYPPWATFHLELFAAVGLCLLGAATFGAPLLVRLSGGTAARPTQSKVALPLAARLWCAVALVPVLQYLLGDLVFRGDALIGLLYGLGVALALYVGLLWAAQQGRARVMYLLCLALVVGGLVAAGLALVQWLRLDILGWWAMELIDDRPYASFAQPNHLGLLMVMAIVAVTVLFETGAVQHRWVWGLAVGVFGWAVLMSQSRSAVLCLVAVSVLWVATRHRVPTRLRLSDLVLGVLVAVVFSLSIDPLQQLLLLKSTEFRASADTGPRQWIWMHFWAAVLERPWFGYGFNQAVLAMAEVAGQVQPSRNVVFAHNVVLDLMTWIGIPLALLMTAAAGVWMSGWLRKTPDLALMRQRHWVFAIWLALVLQSLLEFPYAHSYFLLPAALLAGVVTSLPERHQPPTTDAVYSASRSATLLAAFATVLLGVLAWEYFRIEEDFRHNRFARANFANLPRHEQLTSALVLDQLSALNSSASFKIAPGMPATELEQLHRLARRFHIPSVRLDYAKALALNGRLADAQAEMRVIRSVFHPALYQVIDHNWKLWLDANAALIAAPRAIVE